MKSSRLSRRSRRCGWSVDDLVCAVAGRMGSVGEKSSGRSEEYEYEEVGGELKFVSSSMRVVCEQVESRICFRVSLVGDGVLENGFLFCGIAVVSSDSFCVSWHVASCPLSSPSGSFLSLIMVNLGSSRPASTSRFARDPLPPVAPDALAAVVPRRRRYRGRRVGMPRQIIDTQTSAPAQTKYLAKFTAK